MASSEELSRAVALALAGEWGAAHEIAQGDEKDPLACWLHAVLHKIEGDDWNSRYWYRRAARRYEDYSDTNDELAAIGAALEKAR